MVLGMGDRVVLADYDPEWPKLFESERRSIAEALGGRVVSIEHIGSTSVPGLAAKPIIDILLTPREFPLAVTAIDALCATGYLYMGPNGIPRRQYFTKARFVGTHHLHAFGDGDPEVTRHILFRDYLRAHREESRRYEELKRDLAGRSFDKRDEYTDAKTPLIREMEANARDWWRSRGSPTLTGSI